MLFIPPVTAVMVMLEEPHVFKFQCGSSENSTWSQIGHAPVVLAFVGLIRDTRPRCASPALILLERDFTAYIPLGGGQCIWSFGGRRGFSISLKVHKR
jgi:hypothetical protein